MSNVAETEDAGKAHIETGLASTGWADVSDEGCSLARLRRCGLGDEFGELHGELRGEGVVGKSPNAERASRMSPESSRSCLDAATTLGRRTSFARARRIVSRTFWWWLHVLQSGVEQV